MIRHENVPTAVAFNILLSEEFLNPLYMGKKFIWNKNASTMFGIPAMAFSVYPY
jgi:hypothetical protein